ncbi:NYN domain-containing protein [Sphingomonas sp. NCPPB 2930]
MVVFLIDADNLCMPGWIDEAFIHMQHVEGHIAVKRAYGSAEKLKGVASALREHAVRPFVNLALTKNTTDVALAVDAMELSWQSPRPSAFVIGSGDADFVPLVVRLRERGFRVLCISERGKMAAEALSAYDQVFLVGGAGSSEAFEPGPAAADAILVAKAAAPKKATVAKSAGPAPAAKKAVAKKAAAVKAPAKKAATAKNAGVDAISNVGVQHILAAVPSLRSGEPHALGEVAKSLHDAKLLGKNTASTKLFKKFPHHFELSPTKQPNKVQYILPPGA